MDRTVLALLALCGLVGLHALFILIIGLNNPLVDMFSFRQTQTALSVYWMMQGGPLIAYETPVVGSPWSIPFEFPIYQWIVATLGMIGVPLDAAGRIVSFVFFIACLWPLYIVYRRLNFGTVAYLVTAALYLASPIYIYWGRTFMIETSALFFGLLWLALFVEYINQPRWVMYGWTLLAGVLGALTKSTTFPAFAFLGGLYFLYTFYREWSLEKTIVSYPKWVLLIGLLILPFVPAVLWVMYTDALKETNIIGHRLTSTALSKWNFGTLDHRLSLDLWYKTILKRTLHDIFGYAVYLVYGFVLAILFSCRLRILFFTMFSQRYRGYVFATLFTFFLPFLIFTKIHMVHSYYQTANALFILVAAGLVLGMIAENGYKVIAMIIVAAVTAGQLAFFHTDYFHYLSRTSMSWMRIAQTAKSMTPPDSSLIVIGTDWSSLIAYYAERKSLTVPNWAPKQMLDRIVARPQNFLGNRKLAGIVVCDYEKARRIINMFKPLTDERKVVAKEGNCRLYQ